MQGRTTNVFLSAVNMRTSTEFALVRPTGNVGKGLTGGWNNDNYKASFILATYTLSCIHTHTEVSQRIENSTGLCKSLLALRIVFPLCVSKGKKASITIKPSVNWVESIAHSTWSKDMTLKGLGGKKPMHYCTVECFWEGRVCSYKPHCWIYIWIKNKSVMDVDDHIFEIRAAAINYFSNRVLYW